MAGAVLRLAALLACGYLAGVLGLALLAEVMGWRRLGLVAVHALPRALRRTMTGGAQVGLVAGVLVGSASPVAAAAGRLSSPPPTATATMSQIAGPSEPSVAPPATATMVQLGPAGEERATTPPPQPTSPPSPPGPPPTATTGEWVVQPGESFWSIAESRVAGDVAPYWRQLIAANRDRLVAPDHPDLLIPGQNLVVPPPSEPQ
jgi:hypothetical protein